MTLKMRPNTGVRTSTSIDIILCSAGLLICVIAGATGLARMQIPTGLGYYAVAAALALSVPLLLQSDLLNRILAFSVIPTRRSWPIFIIWTGYIIGVLQSRLQSPDQPSYLAHAIGMLGCVVGSMVGFRAIADPESGRVFTRIWTGVALAGAAWTLYCFVSRATEVHEYVFCLVPAFLPLICRTHSAHLPIAGFTLVAIYAVFGMKNTTFIIAGIVLLSAVAWRLSRTSTSRSVHLLMMLFVSLAFGACLWIGNEFLRSQEGMFSTGNTEFRRYFYGQLWEQFLSSPIYGDLFSKNPTLVYPYASIYGHSPNLPSHSDFLDILAHGGVIFFSAVIVLGWRLGRSAISALNASRPQDDLFLFSSVAAICGLLQASFNPVLHRVSFGFILWFLIGLSLVLHQEQMKREETHAQ